MRQRPSIDQNGPTRLGSVDPDQCAVEDSYGAFGGALSSCPALPLPNVIATRPLGSNLRATYYQSTADYRRRLAVVAGAKHSYVMAKPDL